MKLHYFLPRYLYQNRQILFQRLMWKNDHVMRNLG